MRFLTLFLSLSVFGSVWAGSPEINILKNQNSEIILKYGSSGKVINLTVLLEQGRNGKLNFKEYQKISQQLIQVKADFNNVRKMQCGAIPKIENFSDFKPRFTTAVVDNTSTSGTQARQKQKSFTKADWEHEFFCTDLTILESELFGPNRIYKQDAQLENYIQRYGIQSCQNEDYLKYIHKVRQYEISSQCEKIQSSTQPFCGAQLVKPEALEPLGFAKQLSEKMSELIETQLPVFDSIIKAAESDLNSLQTELNSSAEQMRKMGVGAPQPGQDNLSPLTVDQLVSTSLSKQSRPYADVIKNRKELIKIASDYKNKLKTPIQNNKEVNDRIQSIIRYSPQLVNQFFSELELWADCHPESAKKIQNLKTNLCKNFNQSKNKYENDQKLIDVLNSLSEIAYAGSMGTAMTGNAPASGFLLGAGAVTGVAGKSVKYFTEDDLTSHRALSAAVFKNSEAADIYLNLREQNKNQSLNEIATELAFVATPLAVGKLSKIGTLGSRFETGILRLKTIDPELESTAQNIYKNLTTARKTAIEEAHQIGFTKKLTSQPFSLSELKQKAAILEKAGFTETERTALMRGGITGQPSRVLASIQKNQKLPPPSMTIQEVQNPKNFKSIMDTSQEIQIQAKNFDEARNLAYNMNIAKNFGFEYGSTNRVRYVSRMEKSVYYNKTTGWEIRNSKDELLRIRMDWDPEKGAHFNVEFMKIQRGNSAAKDSYKLAIQFPCNGGPCSEKQALDLLKQVLP